MSRKGEKRRLIDYKGTCANDGQKRRSPRLTSNGECHKQINSNPTNTTNTTTCSVLKADESWLPEKHILELVLDTLQGRDYRDIFAEPVDPSEVEEYYELIAEPMDFGTMRAKLHEGLYKNLHQFEHDMYLIFDNAMYFNPSGTIYFKQARNLEDLAKKVFHTLKTDPGNFETEFSAARRKSSRKLDDEPQESPFGSDKKPAKELGSASIAADIDQKGGRKRRPFMTFIDRRSSYKPWKAVLDETDSTYSPLNFGVRSLIHVDQENTGYRKSLMSFLKDLGPTAQRVAERKLQGLSTQTTDQNADNSNPSTTNPQMPTASSPFQLDLNKPFCRPMPFTDSPNTQGKTNGGVSMISDALDKGKTVKTLDPFHSTQEKTDPSTSTTRNVQDKGKRAKISSPVRPTDPTPSAELRKCDSDSRGTIVLALVAARNRTRRNGTVGNRGSAKESKHNQAGRFDLNQAQPIPIPTPSSSHVSSHIKDGGLMARSTPFDESLPTSRLRETSNPEYAPTESINHHHNNNITQVPQRLPPIESVYNITPMPQRLPPTEAIYNNNITLVPPRFLPVGGVFNHVHNMAQFFSRQFMFNYPYMGTRLNTSLPTVLPQGANIGWPLSSQMSMGQASSSQGHTNRNGFLDINHAPSAHWRGHI